MDDDLAALNRAAKAVAPGRRCLSKSQIPLSVFRRERTCADREWLSRCYNRIAQLATGAHHAKMTGDDRSIQVLLRYDRRPAALRRPLTIIPLTFLTWALILGGTIWLLCIERKKKTAKRENYYPSRHKRDSTFRLRSSSHHWILKQRQKGHESKCRRMDASRLWVVKGVTLPGGIALK